MFAHIPGMHVEYPCTPYDAKGMLKTAIRDDNPVMFVESQLLYGAKGFVPEEEYLIPFGSADIKKAGSDLTIVAWGPAVHLSWTLLLLSPLSPDIHNVAVIVALMPVPVSTTLLTRQYGGSPRFAAQAAVLTTLLAVVTVPAAMWLLRRWLG